METARDKLIFGVCACVSIAVFLFIVTSMPSAYPAPAEAARQAVSGAPEPASTVQVAVAAGQPASQ